MKHSIFALAILACACAPDQRYEVRLPASGNVVRFGDSISSIESQDEVVSFLDQRVRGRLPGVRFCVVAYPARTPYGANCTSYRIHGQDAIIVLSWWGKEGRPGRQPDGPPNLPSGTWSVGDADWEIGHLVSGTYDDGSPVK